jgi:hypothetical protein
MEKGSTIKMKDLMNFIEYLSRKQEDFMCTKDVKLKYLAEDEELPYWFVDFEEHGGYPILKLEGIDGVELGYDVHSSVTVIMDLSNQNMDEYQKMNEYFWSPSRSGIKIEQSLKANDEYMHIIFTRL